VFDCRVDCLFLSELIYFEGVWKFDKSWLLILRYSGTVKEFGMSSKSAETELKQLKTAVHYLVGLLEEGSLVTRYDKETREEIADVLEHLLGKVQGLPDEVPENLVQATAVRAIVEASERFTQKAASEKEEHLARHRREAEVAASIHGHEISVWEQVPGSFMEYQATCKKCGGFVYVSHDSTYNLLLETCERVRFEEVA
jgi:hypothetical protein